MGLSKELWITEEIMERLNDEFVQDNFQKIQRNTLPVQGTGKDGQVIEVTVNDGTQLEIIVRRKQ